MPLSPSLHRTEMSFPCPHCGHVVTKDGSWFRARAHFPCPACHEDVKLSYQDKVALFAKYGGIAG